MQFMYFLSKKNDFFKSKKLKRKTNHVDKEKTVVMQNMMIWKKPGLCGFMCLHEPACIKAY